MVRRFWPAAALVALLAGCFEGGDADMADVAMADLPHAGSDLAILADAVPLEPGGWKDHGPAASDVVAPTDPGPSPADVVEPWQDTWIPADVAASDPGAADLGAVDGGPVSDTLPPDLPGDVPAIGCGNGSSCGPGSVCQGLGADAKCVLLSDCTDQGAMDPVELIQRLFTTGKLFVKVKAMVWVGTPTCGILQQCPDASPCCNDCFASMFIGPKDLPIVLLGRGMTIGCNGTECDVTSSCVPLVPNVLYRVWGEADIIGDSPQFTVEGFCPVEEELPW